MLRKKEGKKKRPFGLEGELKQESHLAIVRKPQVRASGGVVRKDREKHSESEEKMRHFFLLKLHTWKINWWSFHRVFECYNYGELEYSEEDFATGFVVRLYLLLEIYLLYIQFIVDSSLAQT